MRIVAVMKNAVWADPDAPSSDYIDQND